MLAKMQRAWVTEWPGDRGQSLGMVSLCMRFDITTLPPCSQHHEFPRSREDPTREHHVIFGLLDERDLPMLQDAIEKYLHQRRLEDMAEHRTP